MEMKYGNERELNSIKLNNKNNKLNKLIVNLKILNNFYKLIYKNGLEGMNELILAIETILICKNEENGQILQVIYETLDISFLFMNCSQKYLEISLSILQRLILFLTNYSVTVTGPTETTAHTNSTTNSNTSKGPANSTTNNLTTTNTNTNTNDTTNTTNNTNNNSTTTTNSTTTKGANSTYGPTGVKGPLGTRFESYSSNPTTNNSTKVEDTKVDTGVSGVTSGVNSGTRDGVTSGTSDGVTSGTSDGVGSGVPNTVTEKSVGKLIDEIIEKQIQSRLFIELTHEKMKLIPKTNVKYGNSQINTLENKFKFHINNSINHLNKIIKESNLLIKNQIILTQYNHKFKKL